MDKFNLIGQLAAYASTKSMVFLSGAQFNQNYEASQAEYTYGQLILTAEFDAAVQFSRGFSIAGITYSGVIALGRKFEDTGAASTLDETFIQKYNARLYELMTLLAQTIADFACDNELELTQCQFKMDLNKFDTNADFIGATVTFVQ